jgi:hypothetical protein
LKDLAKTNKQKRNTSTTTNKPLPTKPDIKATKPEIYSARYWPLRVEGEQANRPVISPRSLVAFGLQGSRSDEETVCCPLLQF